MRTVEAGPAARSGSVRKSSYWSRYDGECMNVLSDEQTPAFYTCVCSFFLLSELLARVTAVAKSFLFLFFLPWMRLQCLRRARTQLATLRSVIVLDTMPRLAKEATTQAIVSSVSVSSDHNDLCEPQQILQSADGGVCARRAGAIQKTCCCCRKEDPPQNPHHVHGNTHSFKRRTRVQPDENIRTVRRDT